MKKRIALVCLLIVVALMLASCGNRDMFDTVRTFDEGIICLPDGAVIRGQVQSWRDYDDSDQLQVKIDGVTYLVHSEDCVLVAK